MYERVLTALNDHILNNYHHTETCTGLYLDWTGLVWLGGGSSVQKCFVGVSSVQEGCVGGKFSTRRFCGS